MTADPVAIASELIRCRSITPDEGGALSYLQELLTRSGFEVHRAILAEPGTAPVDNLYARIGSARPNLLFAGHTDVVPPGNESAWSHPPFAGEVAEKGLYGRGAVDMKGGIACFVAAALDYLEAHGGKPKGSISLLITGDEESVAVNGTVKLLKWAGDRGESFDHCILGEPSNLEVIGDTIKVGRRGSLNGTLIVTGRQGHVAYPERSDNPIPGLKLDRGFAGAARRRQRTLFAVASGIHVGRRRQHDGQSHSRRSARAFQHPLQRPSQPDCAEDLDRTARQNRGWGPRALFLRVAAVQRGCLCHQARCVHRACQRSYCRNYRAAPEAFNERRHLRRAIHQGLLPGPGIWLGWANHASSRRTRAACRFDDIDCDLQADHRKIFRRAARYAGRLIIDLYQI